MSCWTHLSPIGVLIRVLHISQCPTFTFRISRLKLAWLQGLAINSLLVLLDNFLIAIYCSKLSYIQCLCGSGLHCEIVCRYFQGYIFITHAIYRLNPPGTAGGPGGRERTLAIKRRKKTPKNHFFCKKHKKIL